MLLIDQSRPISTYLVENGLTVVPIYRRLDLCSKERQHHFIAGIRAAGRKASQRHPGRWGVGNLFFKYGHSRVAPGSDSRASGHSPRETRWPATTRA
jgi:hypothetical protein